MPCCVVFESCCWLDECATEDSLTLFNTFVNIVWLTGLVVQRVGGRFCIIELANVFVFVDNDVIDALEECARSVTKPDGNVNVGNDVARLVGRFKLFSTKLFCCIAGGNIFERLLFKDVVRFIPGKLFAIIVIVDESGIVGREIFGKVV